MKIEIEHEGLFGCNGRNRTRSSATPWRKAIPSCISKSLPGRAWRRARGEIQLECVCAEARWLPALFTLFECCTNRFDLSNALLLSLDEITNVFAIVGVAAAFDLRLDPVILLGRQRDGLADGRLSEVDYQTDLQSRVAETYLACAVKASSGNSLPYKRRTTASRRSSIVRSLGREDSTIRRADSNKEDTARHLSPGVIER
jgi:hypothetical protein